MKTIKIVTASFFLSCLFVSLANAAQEKKEPSSFFNSEIFSLSKKKENAFDAPSATYVLSSEDIRRSGATSIPEALRMVPGLQVARMDGNKWAITARGFNRQFSNKLLIDVRCSGSSLSKPSNSILPSSKKELYFTKVSIFALVLLNQAYSSLRKMLI